MRIQDLQISATTFTFMLFYAYITSLATGNMHIKLEEASTYKCQNVYMLAECLRCVKKQMDNE